MWRQRMPNAVLALRLTLSWLAETITQANQGSGFTFAKDDRDAEDIWYSRKVHRSTTRALNERSSAHSRYCIQIALWSALDYLPGAKCWVTDVCVPLSRFPELIAETKVCLLIFAGSYSSPVLTRLLRCAGRHRQGGDPRADRLARRCVSPSDPFWREPRLALCHSASVLTNAAGHRRRQLPVSTGPLPRIRLSLLTNHLLSHRCSQRSPALPD